MFKPPTIPFDYRVLGILFFIWGLLNLVNGVTEGVLNQSVVKVLISLDTLIIAGYYYFIGSKIVLKTLKH